MEISNELIIGLFTAFLASPIAAGFIASRPANKANRKIEDVFNEIEKVSKALEKYQIEQALMDFSSKTIRIVEGNSRAVTIEEWLTSENALKILLPEDEWPASLLKEVEEAKKIIRKGGLS